ncbi:MAG TPA: DUF2170 family protein [Steroidobacteraceae bacterium]
MTRDGNRRRQQTRRQRLRAEGLVAREVWILPDHAPVLLKVEKLLRKPNANALIHALRGVSTAMSNGSVTTHSLLPDLKSGQLAASGRYTFSLVEGLEPVIQAVAHDYGDVHVYLAVTGEIAIVQATLFPVARVRDTTRLNDRILRTEKLFDLANISIDTHPDGAEFYVIYGALRATSAIADVEFEIDTLARNAVDAAAAYREFIK